MAEKRVNEGEESSPKRQKYLNELSEEGPLRQGDVIYFQKEAIFRKLNLYKEELQIAQASLEKWKRSCRLNSEKLASLENWWMNIIEVFKANGVVEKTVVDNIYSHKPDILFVFHHLEEDSKECEEILDLRKKILGNLVDPLINKGQSSRSSSNINDDLKERIESLLKDISYERSRKNSMKQENEVLNLEVKSLQDRILSLVRENDRLTSKTLKRTDETLMKEEENKPEEPVKKETTDAFVVPNGSAVENGEAKNGESTASAEVVENLTIKVSTLKAKVDSLTKQLEEGSSKLQAAQSEVTNLELRLSDLPEDDLQNSIIYKSLVSKVENLTHENNELIRKDSTLLEKMTELESKHKSYEECFEKTLLEEKKSLQLQLEKTEADLARVRDGRDELTAKIDILTSQTKYKYTYDELLKLLDEQKAEIDKLKSLKREELEKMVESEEGDSEAVRNLKSQNQALIEELKQIETAFNSAQDEIRKKNEIMANHEVLVTKLNLEKSKADQKYFGAMRVKDSMTNETKTLKVHNARSNELISQLKEFEKIAQKKNKLLETNLANFKIVNLEKTKEFEALKSKSIEIIKSLDIMKKKFDQLVNDKKTSTTKIHESEEQISTLKTQVDTLKGKINSQEKLITKYRKQHGDVENKVNGYGEMDDERIKGLVSIAKCSICAIRFKSTALKTCGHVFCSECVNDRLNARLRKCPACNCAFSFNDLLSVHL